jgi:protein phosphatase PTC2/3
MYKPPRHRQENINNDNSNNTYEENETGKLSRENSDTLVSNDDAMNSPTNQAALLVTLQNSRVYLHDIPQRSQTPGELSLKSFASGNSSRPSTPTLRSGEYAELGVREFMEDATVVMENREVESSEDLVSFYGVFDGHGGTNAALYLKEHLVENIMNDKSFKVGNVDKALVDAYVQTDLDFFNATTGTGETSGSTACTACLFDGKLIVANAGDSRCVVSRRGIAHDLTRDQKPTSKDEEERIKKAGGFIEDGYVNGLLGVSRAFGDWHFDGLKRNQETGKPGPLTAEPEIDTWQLDIDSDEFIILACDGLWDVFSSQNAIDFARKSLLANNDPNRAAKELADEALRRHSADNISVVCVCFGDDPPRSRTPEPSTLSPGSSNLSNQKKKSVERSLSLEVLNHLQTLVAEDEQKPMADNLHGISPKRVHSVRLLTEFQNQQESNLSPQNSNKSRRAGSNSSSSFETEEIEQAPSAKDVANVLAKVGFALNNNRSEGEKTELTKSEAETASLECGQDVGEANRRLSSPPQSHSRRSTLAGSSLEESELGKIAEESFADALRMREE